MIIVMLPLLFIGQPTYVSLLIFMKQYRRLNSLLHQFTRFAYQILAVLGYQ